MLSSSLNTLLKVSKTTSLQKLSAYNCVSLFMDKSFMVMYVVHGCTLQIFRFKFFNVDVT